MRKSVSLGMRFLLGAAALLLASVPARAQFPDQVSDNVHLKLGGIFASFNSETALSGNNNQGDLIDLTGLGLTPDHKNTFRGEGYWNFLGRFYLDFGYVDFSLDGSRSITRDIHFGDYVFKAGAEVAAETSHRYIYGALRYAVLRNETFRLGLSLGVTYYSSSVKLSAQAGVERPDGTVVSGGTSAERKLDTPVPMIGAEFEIRLARNLTLAAYARGVGATIDPYSGSWVEYAGNINWYFSNNFGLGGAYEYQKIHIEKDASQPNAFRWDSRYDGPRVYMIVAF